MGQLCTLHFESIPSTMLVFLLVTSLPRKMKYLNKNTIGLKTCNELRDVDYKEILRPADLIHSYATFTDCPRRRAAVSYTHLTLPTKA